MDRDYNYLDSHNSNGFVRVPCPRCASGAYKILYHGVDYLYKIPGNFFVVRCSSCGLVYQNPCPAPDQISKYYPADYLPHTDNLDAVHNQNNDVKLWWWHYFKGMFGSVYNRLLGSWQAGCNLTPTLIEGGKLLEIGCANGRRLVSLRDQGWTDLHGIELIDQAAKQARRQGFSVITGPIEHHLASFPDASLDVVITSMVLEHLCNPFEIVRLIADKLKPGGQFLFSTIVTDSLDARIYGKYFAGFDLPRHLVHFKKNDIENMLEPYFKEVECFYQNAPIDYVRSSTWRIENGDGSVFDKSILKFGNSRLALIIGLILSQLGLTCRVSFRCIKKMEL